MHPYRILAQISLILSIFNLVLAAPIVAQEIHGAPADETVVAEDPEAPSDRPTSPQPSPASPQHSSSSDESGYHATPDRSPDSIGSDDSWWLEAPPRSPVLPSPASLHEPHPSNPGSSESLPPWYYHALEPALIRPSSPQPFLPEPESSEGLEPEMPPPPSSSGSEVDLATTDTYSPQDRFTPSHHLSSSTDWNSDVTVPTPLSSASDGSLSSQYFSASDESASSHPMPEGPDGSASLHPIPEGPDGSASSHPMPEGPDGSAFSHPMPEGLDGSPPSLSSPPTKTPSDDAEFFNKDMMKKVKIGAGVTIVGGAIAAIVGAEIKHHKDS